MGPGWIKFYRKTFNGERSLDEVARWLWLLCAAEYEGEYRGKFITTIPSIASYWDTTPRRAAILLKSWEQAGQITVLKIKRSEVNFEACTLPSAFTAGYVLSNVVWGVAISIINYSDYQGGDEKAEVSHVHSSGNLCLKKNKKEELSLPSGEMGKNINKRVQPSRPTSKHREVIDHYHETFRRRFGRKYIWQARDFGILKRLMKSLDADDLMHRISEYLSDEEPFLLKNGHTVALFQNRVNAYGKPNFGGKHTEGSGFLKSVY